LDKLEKETSAEVAVLTIEKLPEVEIEEYAVEVFENWGIGKKDEDNGVLLLVSRDDRKIRIEVGYGLEGVINDGRAGSIIRDEISPKFKKEDYEGGTWDGVSKIEEYIKDGSSALSEVPTSTKVTAGKPARQEFASGIWVIVGFIVIIYLMSFLGRSKEWTTGGVIGMILGLLMGGLLVGIILGIFGLILDFILSGNYKKLKKSGKSTSFWKSRGGFSGGGGGGGGFGGGSSGGGGASGGW